MIPHLFLSAAQTAAQDLALFTTSFAAGALSQILENGKVAEDLSGIDLICFHDFILKNKTQEATPLTFMSTALANLRRQFVPFKKRGRANPAKVQNAGGTRPQDNK